MLTVICFSKDRPMQVHAYIESLLYFSNLKQEFIYILYAETEGISYQKVISCFPKVNWIKEKSFYSDLLTIVEKSENFIFLGCDDVFFKDFFDINVCIKQLAIDSSSFGFSLRMGINLNYLPNVTLKDDLVVWDWTKTNNMHWNYPWDVSASVYRKSFVLDYIKSDNRLSNPNRFEAYLADYIKLNKQKYKPLLSSFQKSKALTLTINRVQDEFPNEFDSTASSDLHTLQNAYLNGKRLDWFKFNKTENKNIHVDSSYFSLTDQFDYPAPKLTLIESSPISQKIKLSIGWKIWYWKIYIVIKETIRPFLPRIILHKLRKFVN